MVALKEDQVAFDLEEVRGRWRKVVYQLTFRFSDLNRVAPLVFGGVIDGYVRFCVESVMTDWGDVFITKCAGFMMYKLLNTFFFYRGMFKIEK